MSKDERWLFLSAEGDWFGDKDSCMSRRRRSQPSRSSHQLPSPPSSLRRRRTTRSPHSSGTRVSSRMCWRSAATSEWAACFPVPIVPLRASVSELLDCQSHPWHEHLYYQRIRSLGETEVVTNKPATQTLNNSMHQNSKHNGGFESRKICPKLQF